MLGVSPSRPYSVGLQLGDLVDVAAWGIVPWYWGCGTKKFRCLGVFREKASRGPLSDFIIELWGVLILWGTY